MGKREAASSLPLAQQRRAGGASERASEQASPWSVAQWYADHYLLVRSSRDESVPTCCANLVALSLFAFSCFGCLSVPPTLLHALFPCSGPTASNPSIRFQLSNSSSGYSGSGLLEWPLWPPLYHWVHSGVAWLTLQNSDATLPAARVKHAGHRATVHAGGHLPACRPQCLLWRGSQRNTDLIYSFLHFSWSCNSVFLTFLLVELCEECWNEHFEDCNCISISVFFSSLAVCLLVGFLLARFPQCQASRSLHNIRSLR